MKKDLSHLSPIQFCVTQENGTEVPYENEFWNHFEQGIYVDIVSSEPLFCSIHKFESSCGWPAFYQALEVNNIVKIVDNSHGMQRVEVRSKSADSHLGHIFNDGPIPTGVRYCINSAALSFIAKKDLKASGFEKYLNLFETEVDHPEVIEETATFGAGCFWGVEAILSNIKGVIDTKVGYAGGETTNPRYEDISTGTTGHAEVVQVRFNNLILSYEQLLDYFFRLHDPTALNRQGYDEGTQYRSVIFYHNQVQYDMAQEMIKNLTEAEKYPEKIVTSLEEFSVFYDAEQYHQKYYDKKYSGAPGRICHFLRDV